MTRFATLPNEERLLYLQAATGVSGIDPIVLEKDFWVCWTLARVFEGDESRQSLLFKGGTCLAKAWGSSSGSQRMSTWV